MQVDTMDIRFLIVRIESQNEVFLAIPLLRCIKQQVDGAIVHFLTNEKYLDLFRDNQYIDQLFCLSSNNIKTIPQVLGKQDYHYVIDLQNDGNSKRLTKNIRTVHFNLKHDTWKRLFYIHFRIGHFQAKQLIDRYFDLVSVFDVTNDKKPIAQDIPITTKFDIATIDAQFLDGYCVMLLGAKYATRRLPIEKAVALCLNARYPIVLLGYRDDYVYIDQIINATSKADDRQMLNACEMFDLPTSIEIIRRAKLVVTCDNDWLQIAVSFNQNVFILWGNTISENGNEAYLPVENCKNIEVKPLKCRPCSERGFSRCPEKHFRCMNEINVTEVFS